MQSSVIKSIVKLNRTATVAFAGYIIAFMLIVLVAGCSGGNEATPTTGSIDPVNAKTGPIVAVRVGETATLDGSDSFTSFSAPLSYNWTFAHKPDTSKTVLQGASTANPNFVADIKGVYTVQLVANANGATSKRAVQIVVVTQAGEPLTGPANHVGLSSTCVSCHDGVLVDPAKSPDHVGTSNTCQTCHTPQGADIIHFVDHLEVFGNCSGCHNGVIAVGKSESHTPTNLECDNCHNTTSFLSLALDGSFDHSNVGRFCSGCHNGIIAIGKHESHIITDIECSSCHAPTSFKNAYPDHTDPAVIANGCDSCHGASDGQGGLIAKGQTVGHPITNVDCVVCHRITTFSLGGVFNHSLVDAVVQSCESCHNDNNSINAPGKGSAINHPATTSDCGACHNTESFLGAFFDHTGIVSNCATSGCHTGLPGEAIGKPLATAFSAHVPTNDDCSVCHTPGTFSTGIFDHAGITNNCNSCHDNIIGVGKLPNHIPTSPDNQDCADCHNTASFANATFDHSSSDTSSCLACHDSNISKGKPSGHVVTSQNCSSCHVINNGFTTFAGTFVHDASTVNGNCASCHNTGIAPPKRANHIPAQAECSQCHGDTNIGGFASNSFLGNVHTGITSGCDGCHISRIMLPRYPGLIKNNLHLPTTQDCDTCHTNSSFAAPTSFSHAGITSNCSLCHNGNFAGIGARGKTPNHPATTQDCSVCHNTASFAGATFDHTGRVSNCNECHADNATGAVTKKNPGHIATSQDCSLCHVPGTFANAVFDHTGIVNNCASCHAGSGAIGTVKNNGHLPTTEDCSVCHNTRSFAGAKFDHQGITNNCASCHEGATARGKTPPPNHVPTNKDCSVCHLTTGFIPANFDHAGIVNNCASCHDGSFAKGKSNDHIATFQDCSVCHNTRTPLDFSGAVFDHTGIVNNCASCHNGTTAIGKEAKTNPAHITTSLDCSSCHTTATFAGAKWVHDSSTAGNCDQCHSTGGGATIKPGNHINTTEQCDVCHSTNGWAPSIFSHSPQGNYPGNHRVDPGCNQCHGNNISSSIPWPFAQYAPDCAACHANDFESESDHIGGKNGTVEQNRNCATSGCHKVSDREFD